MAYIDVIGDDIYNGRTIWSIVRRVWGRSKKLRIWRHGDRNSPTWGTLLQECETGGYIVVAEIYDADGPLGIDNNGDDQDDEEVFRI